MRPMSCSIGVGASGGDICGGCGISGSGGIGGCGGAVVRLELPLVAVAWAAAWVVVLVWAVPATAA